MSEVSPIINEIGSTFYFNPATLERGKALGLDGFRWYFIGRGGVLGDVEASVVTSAFGYFEHGLVDKIWTSAKAVIAPREAARIYLECAQDIGRAKFGGVDGLEDFCASAEAVLAAAHPAGLALFAGLNAEPRCEDLPGRTMQLLATLRELRGSAHLVAVVASGVAPRLAHQIKRPDMLKSFGYGEELPTADLDAEKLAAAETITDAILLPLFSVLDDAAADRFAAAVHACKAALAG